MIRPTPEQRAEMAAYIDAKEPGLLDELGIPRTDVSAHTLRVVRGRYIVAKCDGCNWTAPEPFGYLSSAKQAHTQHVASLA